MYEPFKNLKNYGKTLRGLQFFDFCGSSFLKITLTSATFNLFGKLEVKIVLLNSFVKTSE